MDKDFEKEYLKLNDAQKIAVDTIDGPVIVIAGPGSGKTQLLSMRVANILKLTDELPNNILCLTFTEAAADNLRVRLVKLVGPIANRVEIYTFHGFGTHIIQNYPEYFYDKPLLTHINELSDFELVYKLLSKLHHDNPLSQKIGDEFLHQSTVTNMISWFKQAGLKPNDLRLESVKSKSFFNHINKSLNLAFKDTPSPKYLNLYVDLHKTIVDFAKQYPSHTATISAQELEIAISDVSESSRYAKSITEWRKNWLIQTKAKKWQYIDQQRNTILVELSSLYEDYEAYLASHGLYSYDDMILRTYEALESNEELKLMLQEQYQHILVDEYQDTNGAQDKLLIQLADNLVNEGRPNLMVVGDDDQAIYRFQGAESSIMYDFIKRYVDPEIIVLDESYRSGQELLDTARSVILNAEDRLENKDSRISKILSSSGAIKSTKIRELKAGSETEYYIHIANKISKLIQDGANPNSIALIAPKHKYLKLIVPYLQANKIPINYERREQVLEQPRIIEIIDLIDLTWAVANLKNQTIEALLPKILAADYFELPIKDLWSLAMLSQKDRKGWMETIRTSNNEALKDFCEAIKKIAFESKNQSFDLIFAYITGNKSLALDDGRKFDMPWRDYYFSEKKIFNDPAEYIHFMSQFNTLLETFKEWSTSNTDLVTIDSFRNFIDLFKMSHLTLLDESPYMSAKDAVSLLTAYKAKGLEWDNVFILNSQNDVWGSKARNRNQTFKLPAELKWIEPARDSTNDMVRLFYVAITRAKKSLYLSSYDKSDLGQQIEPLEWLNDISPALVEEQLESITPIKLVDSYKARWQDLYTTSTKDLSIILKPFLTTYKLSATHVNEFLAIDRGGPKNFLFQHILRVPSVSNNNMVYGDVVHKTLEFTHNTLSSTQAIPPIDEIINFFNEKLRSYPLNSTEFKYLKKRGEDNLNNWFGKQTDKFDISDISEHNFASDNIVIGDARITGKIDVLRKIGDDGLKVIDYKTSKPIYGWSGNSGTNAIKSHFYQKQLIFYKLLVDNSSSVGRKYQANIGQIDFITPDEESNIVSLEYEYKQSELDHNINLINIIWKKILSLDFPDTSSYPDNLTGIRQFESDLISGKI